MMTFDIPPRAVNLHVQQTHRECKELTGERLSRAGYTNDLLFGGAILYVQ